MEGRTCPTTIPTAHMHAVSDSTTRAGKHQAPGPAPQSNCGSLLANSRNTEQHSTLHAATHWNTSAQL